MAATTQALALRVNPIRSMLYMPGHRERWIASARASGADAVVFDLEDSVPVAEIKAARRTVRAALDRYGQDLPKLFVRTAPPSSEAIGKDLDAIVCRGLSGVLLPLVTEPVEVKYVADKLDQLEAERGLELGSTAIVPIVETARSARFAYEIAAASPRVAYMGGGTSRQGDIAREIGYRWTPGGQETLVLRSWVLMSVLAAGVPFPMSGMWSELDDPDGLREFALQSRGLGYFGLTCIHPVQVPVINEVFTPAAAEIERWQQVIAAMRSAQAEGVGAIRFHGALVDEAHVKTAQLGLRLAEGLGLLPSSSVDGAARASG